MGETTSGSSASGVASAGSFTDAVGALKGIFGSSGGTSGTGNSSGTSKLSGTSTSFLEIGQNAIDKIVADLLGTANGVKDIFSQEKVAGIFDSSTAQGLAGDLASKVVGEITKLLAKQVSTQDATETNTSVSKQEAKTKDEGLIGGLKNLF